MVYLEDKNSTIFTRSTNSAMDIDFSVVLPLETKFEEINVNASYLL